MKWARWLLVLAGIALGVRPLVAPPDGAWLRGPGRRVGFALLAAAAAVTAPAIAGRRKLWPSEVFLAVALPLYVLAVGNGRVLTSGDNLATRRLGAQLVTSGTLDLADVPELREPALHYAALRVGPRVLSSFPLGTGLLSVPYAGLARVLRADDPSPEEVGRREKHFAALLTAASVALFFLALRARFGDALALAGTALFALGTPAFTTASQAMWSMTGELFCLCVTLLLVLPEGSEGRAAAAGTAMGAAFLCRPTALLVAAAVALVLARRGWRRATPFAASLVVSVVASAAWLHAMYGHVLGGYGLLNPGTRWHANALLAGLAGNLLSPSRGLLVHCPFLLLVPLGWATARRDADLRAWWLASVGVTAAVLLLASSYEKWWGGASIGPRLATETAPFLALLLVPVLARWRELGRARVAVAGSTAFAVATQVFSAYDPRVADWSAEARVDQRPEVLWSLRESQLLTAWTPRALQPPPPPREDETLLGSVDDPAEGGALRGTLLVRGWARMPGADLGVEFELDGVSRRPVAFRRANRPDVCAVFPEMSPCDTAGYEAFLPPPPGRERTHELVAVFHAKDGRTRHFPVRRFGWSR